MGITHQRGALLRQQGFTLVELLVVIAIISILAAMLLPALESALSSARIASCMSNQHQISLAFNMYSAEADGNISPQWCDVSSAGQSASITGPYFSRNPNDRVKVYWNGWAKAAGLGVLNHLGYIEDARALYCPDQSNSQFAWEGSSSGGSTDPIYVPAKVLGQAPARRPGNASINCGYMYRPYGPCSSGHANNPAYPSCYLPKILYTKLGEANPYHVVSCDVVFRPKEMAHANQDVVPKINALRMDGSVISRYLSGGACAEIVKYQNNGTVLDQTWGRPDNSCRANSPWAVMWYIYSLHDNFVGP